VVSATANPADMVARQRVVVLLRTCSAGRLHANDAYAVHEYS
jgi:hypothetical protein